MKQEFTLHYEVCKQDGELSTEEKLVKKRYILGSIEWWAEIAMIPGYIFLITALIGFVCLMATGTAGLFFLIPGISLALFVVLFTISSVIYPDYDTLCNKYCQEELKELAAASCEAKLQQMEIQYNHKRKLEAYAKKILDAKDADALVSLLTEFDKIKLTAIEDN